MSTFTKKMKLLVLTAMALVCFAFTGMAQNLVTNPGFETWTGGKPDGWFGTRTNLTDADVIQYTANVHGGSSACQLINATSSNKRLTTQPISVVGGQAYTIKFWVRGHGDCRSGVWDGQGTGGDNYIYDEQVINVNATTWAQQTFTVTAPATVNNAEFIILVRNTNADKDHLQFDDVEVTTSGGVVLKADFKADKTTASAGSTIQFTDLSTGNPLQWNWTISSSVLSQPMTSTQQNPSFVFETVGSYDVKLVVSNAEESSTEEKKGYITIGDFILNQDFNDGTFGNWTTVSVIGDQKWIISTSGGPDGSPCAQMNGYAGGNNANEDWLVSPTISACDLLVSFDNAMNFSGDVLKFMYTTKYTGDVTTTSWTEKTFTASTGTYTWINSGDLDINLCGLDATDIRIAFKYTSSTSSGALWRVDNIFVKHSGGSSIPTVEKSACKIYPNPSTGIFNIESEGNASVKVFNVVGSLIKEQMISGTTQVDLSTSPQGIYFMRILQENGVTVTKKVMIK